MTKKELCEFINISRPTLDSKLNSENKDLYLFLLSFELWEARKRIEDYRDSKDKKYKAEAS